MKKEVGDLARVVKPRRSDDLVSQDEIVRAASQVVSRKFEKFRSQLVELENAESIKLELICCLSNFGAMLYDQKVKTVVNSKGVEQPMKLKSRYRKWVLILDRYFDHVELAVEKQRVLMLALNQSVPQVLHAAIEEIVAELS